MNLIALAFIMLIQLCCNSSSEERREQEGVELAYLNELWHDKRFANHSFGAAMQITWDNAESVLDYWAFKGGAEMASFTWWFKPNQKSVYFDYNPAIIVDLHDEKVKIYGFGQQDSSFFNPAGKFQAGSVNNVEEFLREKMNISGFVRKRDWDWDVSKTQSPKEGIHPKNLLWKAMDDHNQLAERAAVGRDLPEAIKEQNSFDFTKKNDLTTTFANKFEGMPIKVHENEMVLSFDIKAIKGIIYHDQDHPSMNKERISHAKAMKKALMDKGINVPILTFKGDKIIKSPADADTSWAEEAAKKRQRSSINSPTNKGEIVPLKFEGNETVRSPHDPDTSSVQESQKKKRKPFTGDNQSNGAKRGRVCTAFLIVFSVLCVLFV